MKTLRASFNELRENGGSVMLFKIGKKYEAFYADAITLAKASNCRTDFLIDADGRRMKHASIDEDEISDVICRLPASVNKVVIHLDSRG